MTPIERLYYALGEVAYAIAKADGNIQKEERDSLNRILEEEFKKNKTTFDLTEIIFQILRKESGTDSKTAFEWAMKEIKLNSQYVSEPLKQHFVAVIEKVAEAFPPVTHAERILLNDFLFELKKIKGDPVFSIQTE
jgi:hypothetical protein